MKKVSILLICFLTAISVQAQTSISVQAEQKTSSVSIIVNGSKNLQITIDERNSSLLNMRALIEKTSVSMENLAIGTHTLLIVRTNQNNDRTERIETTFNLRYNYDMLIKVNRNGSLELIETKHTGTPDNLVAMSDRDFNTLLTSVRNQRSTAKRSSAITNAFNNNKYFFTTSQVKQLLLLVNSESSRIQLAKQSYPNITDRSNFYLLYELLNSEAGRNELEDFVTDYNDDRNSNTAMSDASYNALYQEIKNQWNENSQMNSLTNAFNIADNNFTTSQAIQLIQIVSTESYRLQLAKLSYRSIVDPNNFNQVFSLLNSQASQNELAVYVNNYHAGNGTNNAMSDANFNTLFQDIKNQWNVNIQMTSLTNAFNNTYNYFSSHQASQLIQLVNNESNRLQLAKLSYRSITDPGNFNQVYNLLNSQTSQNELAVYVNNYKAGNGTDYAMSDASFKTLYQDIKNQWNDNTQMTSLTNAFNNTNNYFSSYQASQLIQLVSDESNRLQLAKLSYRSITDPGNFNQVVSLISSQTGKNELTAYVNNNFDTGSSPNIAMSDADFTALIQSIERQFLPFEQMNSLTEVFNNTNNYFTSAQVKQLIPLVSYESNRLQLAKLSYRTITDRGNFSQLKDLLNNQSSRNELDDYVKAYKD